MNISEAIQQGIGSLQGVYSAAEATNILRLLVEEVTGLQPAAITPHKQQPLTHEQQRQLEEYIGRLQAHEPVQYLLSHCWFYGLKLYVNGAVLIPRPETEELVHWVVTDVKRSFSNRASTHKANTADASSAFKMLDVGTGSGCIALALKKELSDAEVWGCDVSEEALNVARRNGAALNIRVDFQGIDFLNEAQQKSLPQVNVIVSNPPYVPAAQRADMAANVTDWEPHTALFVPDADALLFYRALVGFAKTHLLPGGAVYVEINEALGKEVVALFTEAGLQNAELKKDMQGKDRMVKAEWLNN